MSLKGDVTFHTALVSGVSHAFHVCLQPSYQGQKNEIKPFCPDVTLETELHSHPFWWPTDVYPPSNQSRLFELFHTLWNENSNSFHTEIPPSANCIHLPISEHRDSMVFILICLSGVLYGLWLTQSISVKLSFLIAWLVIRCGRLAGDLIMQDKCLVKTKIGLKPYFNMQLN